MKKRTNTEEVPVDQLIFSHEVKILEHDTRLNSLENIIHEMQQKYPVFWDVIEDDNETK